MKTARIASFLNEIGIPTCKGDVLRSSFLPNITIKDGGIIYNEKALICDMLHEAGHLAIVPAKYRHMCQADMGPSHKAILRCAEEEVEMDLDGFMAHAVLQMGDCEATAWGWAVGKYLGFPGERIITDSLYNGGGKLERLRLSEKSHFGINGLRASGMLASVKDYPKLARWTQV